MERNIPYHTRDPGPQGKIGLGVVGETHAALVTERLTELQTDACTRYLQLISRLACYLRMRSHSLASAPPHFNPLCVNPHLTEGRIPTIL